MHLLRICSAVPASVSALPAAIVATNVDALSEQLPAPVLGTVDVSSGYATV